MSALALGRLLRLSLAPSAAADVAAGLTLASGGVFPAGPRPWLLIAASLAVYTGNLALNDWADREHDGRTRADRPIPSGRVSPRGALALALGLQLTAIALATAAAPRAGLWIAAIAVAASFYNLRGRGPWLGPLLLGLCRAANLGAGIALVSEELLPGHAVACGLYATYVFLASRLGRMEDAEDPGRLGTRARLLVAAAGTVFFALPAATYLELPGLPHAQGFLPAVILACYAGGGLLLHAFTQPMTTRGDVEKAMGMLLRRLLFYTAIVAVLSVQSEPPDTPALLGGLVVALLILCGYPLSFLLRKVFPPS